jgi:hypothetical protein
LHLQDLSARFEVFKSNVDLIHSYNAQHASSHQVCMLEAAVTALHVIVSSSMGMAHTATDRSSLT